MEGNPDLLVEFRIGAPVVQNADDVFQGINLYPGNNATSFPNSYPLECDLYLVDSAVKLLNSPGQGFGIRNLGKTIWNPAYDWDPKYKFH